MSQTESDGALPSNMSLFAQCAESKVYTCDFYGIPAICKHRFPKRYRHPKLDQKLREQRTAREARALALCRQHGVRAPTVHSVDRNTCRIVMERIDGTTVKDVLDAEKHEMQQQQQRQQEGTSGISGNKVNLAIRTARVTQLLTKMGEVVGRLHTANIIHGDLTTSNFMCTPPASSIGNSSNDAVSGSGAVKSSGAYDEELVVIDFGLVTNKNSAEERAVDLYVLERAITSTHPFVETYAAEVILEGYKKTIDAKKGKDTLARLEVVRARGRKRSMIG